MKSLLITLVALQLCLVASGQETSKEEISKKKEVGIVFSNFNNFGATFRAGNTRCLWRYSAFLLSAGNSKYTDTNNPDMEYTSSSFGTQISFGKEFRKEITERFTLRYGADAIGRYSKSKSEATNVVTSEFSRNNTVNYTIGFNLVLGGNFALSDNFLLGVELLPYLQYQNGSTKVTSSNAEPRTSDNSGVSYGLSSTSVLLSLVYRWYQ